MTDAKTHDADFQGSFFALEIDALTLAWFTGCSGLSLEFDVTTYKESNGKKVDRAQAGRASRSTARSSLKRGFTTNKVVHDWFKEVVDAAKPTPYKTASIVHLRPPADRVRPLQPRGVLAVEDVGLRPQRRQRRRDGRGADDPARVPRLGEALTVAGLQTEFAFTLPKGYVDGDGDPAPPRHDAPGDGARRDRAAARPADQRAPTTRT